MTRKNRRFGRTRLRLGLVICAALVVPRVAAGDAMPDPADRVLRPDQEGLLAEMLGSGEILPGGCRFTGGGIDGASVTARYDCGGEGVEVELREPDAAVDGAQRTKQFAVVVRAGRPPTELASAIAERVRAREARLEWNTVTRLPVSSLALTLGISAIIMITLLVQIPAGFVARRAGHEVPQPLTADLRHRSLAGFCVFSLVAGYLFTRLCALTRLPVFVDESVHIEWARAPLGHYFIPEVLVGKWLPLQFMTFAMFLPLSPLAAARLPSVLMGLATLAACIAIDAELFSVGEGLLAGVVYVFLPFSVLYDRLALADIYLTAFGAWSVYAALATMRPRAPLAPLALTLTTYGAILSKPTGGLFLVVPLLGALMLLESTKDRVGYLGRCVPTLAGGAALLLFLLHGSFGTSLIAQQSQLTGTQGLMANVATLREWLTRLLTPLVAWFVAVATLWGLVCRRRKAEAFLGALLLLAILPYLLISKVWFPRYLLFVTVPVSLLLARAISVAAQWLARAARRFSLPGIRPWMFSTAMILGFATAAVPTDDMLIREPEHAELPAADRSAYVSGWTSGYGLSELAAFLHEQAGTGDVNVLRFAGAGPANQGLDLYMLGETSLHPATIDPRDHHAGEQIANAIAMRRTVLVLNGPLEPEQEHAAGQALEGAARLWTYTRPGAESSLDVWEISRPRIPQ